MMAKQPSCFCSDMYISDGMKLCINNNMHKHESISLKERVPMLRMGLGETETALIYVKTTIHILQCMSSHWLLMCVLQEL